MGADSLWAAVAAEDDGQQTELPASLQRAVEEALEDGTACFPGAPASTRSSLEAAAWEFLKRVRASKRNEKDDDGKEDSDSLDVFDVGGEPEAEAAEAKASIRAARRILQDPAIAAYLDRTHLTQPPAEYLDALQQREDAGSGSARVRSEDEAGRGAAAQWRGNWLGVGGHWTSLMHACRSGAIDVVNGILAHNSSLASLAGTHSEKYSLVRLFSQYTRALTFENTPVEPSSGFTALHWAAASAAEHLTPLSARGDAALKMMHDEAQEDAEDPEEQKSTHVLCARALLGLAKKNIGVCVSLVRLSSASTSTSALILALAYENAAGPQKAVCDVSTRMRFLPH